MVVRADGGRSGDGEELDDEDAAPRGGEQFAGCVEDGDRQRSPGDGDSRGVKRTGETSVAEVAPTELRLWGAPDAQRCAGDSGGPSFADLDPGLGLELRLIGVASRTGAGRLSRAGDSRRRIASWR